MENDWEARKLCLNLVEHVECERRRNEKTGLRVSCALLRLELVSSVGSSDGDCERVAACAGCEINHLLRLGVVRLLSRNLILNTCEYSELSLNSHVKLVSILDNLLGEGDVLLIRKSRTVNHH